MVNVEAVLAAALICISTVHRIPQILLTLGSGEIGGLSVPTLWLNLVYSTLYICYGIIIEKLALIAIGIVTTAQASSMISLYYYYRR